MSKEFRRKRGFNILLIRDNIEVYGWLGSTMSNLPTFRCRSLAGRMNGGPPKLVNCVHKCARPPRRAHMPERIYECMDSECGSEYQRLSKKFRYFLSNEKLKR